MAPEPDCPDRSDDPLRERLVGSEPAWAGRLLAVRVETRQRGDGGRVRREVIEHPGAVAIVALDDAGRVVLVRQFRAPTDRSLLEIPAGTLDRDPARGTLEAPEPAARRELEEETGLRARSWERLGGFWTAPGYATEFIHLFLATDLAPAGSDRAGPDEDEQLEIVHLSWREAVAAVERGELTDAKTIIGLLWLARRLDVRDAAAPRPR
jgi:ADP-ribose pyrophosphatase